jgi:UTP-glucose-1-phosphate uridylyltransferase
MQTDSDVSLFILAGGLGSRFGGDKQVAELPHFGKTIMELNILDAYAAGVRRVVMIINEKVSAIVQGVILPRLPNDLEVCLVNQQLNDLPKGFEHKAVGRSKPWGTGHALWCARHLLTGPSILITADDYYGDDAFVQLVRHFQHAPNMAAIVAYPLGKTLSEQGGVNRGICLVENGVLINVEEHLNIRRDDNRLTALDVHNNDVELSDSDLASMTCWGLTASLKVTLEHEFIAFLEKYDNDVKMEYYLPDCIQRAVDNKQLVIKAYKATQPWFGITYQQELAQISEKIYELRHGRR